MSRRHALILPSAARPQEAAGACPGGGGGGDADYAPTERAGSASSPKNSHPSTAGVGTGGSAAATAPITPNPSGSMEGIELVRGLSSSDAPTAPQPPWQSMSAGI